MDKQSEIIRFGYKDLKLFEDVSKGEKVQKSSALCTACGVKITERRGTASGFVRYSTNVVSCMP